jgi:hypothetical protein
MLPSLPGGGDSEATITEFYAGSGNRITVIAAMYLLVLAGIAFIGFISDLHRRLRQAEGESGPLATIALVAGAVFVTMLYAASAAWGVSPRVLRLVARHSRVATFQSGLPSWVTRCC